MNKPLSQRRVDEIRAIFVEYDLPIPIIDGELASKKELLAELSRNNITNKTLKSYEEKPHNKLNIEEEAASVEGQAIAGDVVVCMTRKNPVYIWKDYKFTTQKRYIPMKREEANTLIQKERGFHIATREEIKRYYQ